MSQSHGSGQENLKLLMLGALGVVYGDIGTSPLYAMRECFSHVQPTEVNVLGVLSLIFWSLIFVVSLKYVTFILRADNRGEGGILALISLVLRHTPEGASRRALLMGVAIFGAALFYGDGMITPAISVLSAVEGLEIATPVFKRWVIPLTILILVGLFLLQKRGTAKVGALFGPIMAAWFTTLAVMGIFSIIDTPKVLYGLNPWYGFYFLKAHGWVAFVTLGAVVLAVTGAEALYADMGHFGRKPIQLAWFFVVGPSLVLNYFGQGALILRHPAAVKSPFYLMVPDWALLALVCLATAAAVIASQAVISGAFSITRQGVQLGYWPRLQIQHTSADAIGQIYVPSVNWLLLLSIIGLVVGFKSSDRLASAYGIAVTGTMLASTILAYYLARYAWKWPTAGCIALLVAFATVDLTFFGANALKLAEGGWFPLVVGFVVYTLMTTWKRGRKLLIERLQPGTMPIDPFLASVERSFPHRVPGTSIFMTSISEGVPHAMLHNMKHNKVLHERVVLLTVQMLDVPWVSDSERVKVESLGHEFYRIFIQYGFKEDPDIPRELELCEPMGLHFDMMDTSFFLSRETLVASARPGMTFWRERLFAGMARNARSVTDFFNIPPNRVVELGAQVEL